MANTQRTVVVTGGTGFLGRRLVQRLLTGDELNVRVLARERSAIDPLFTELSPDQRSRLIIERGELTDSAFLTGVLAGAEVVFHLAAALTGTVSQMETQTLRPTEALLKGAQQAGVGRVVLVSSLGVYGPPQPGTSTEIDEQSPVDPEPERRDPYTLTKIRQEQLTREFCAQHKLPLVVVRPGVIYGPGRPLITSRVGLQVGPLLLRMGGNHPLPYVHVENCAEGVKLAGLEPGIAGETFNLVDDATPSGEELIRLLRRRGRRLRVVPIPGACVQPLSSLYETCSWWTGGRLPPLLTSYRSAALWSPVRYSNAKAKHKLHWTQPIPTEQGLETAIGG